MAVLSPTCSLAFWIHFSHAIEGILVPFGEFSRAYPADFFECIAYGIRKSPPPAQMSLDRERLRARSLLNSRHSRGVLWYRQQEKRELRL